MALKVLIAGGGTGGHIYPALAIAAALKEINSSSQVEFVGTLSGLEAKLIPRSGFTLHFVPIGRLNQVSFFERLWTLFCLPRALWKAMVLVQKFKPDVVLGVGGYASGPLVLVAAMWGCRTAIWEPNAYPGLANRWLSCLVDQCLVVFTEAQKYLHSKNIISVPMPVRKEIEICHEHTGDSHNEFHVLLFGGSQGARPLNNALSSAVMENADWMQGIQIVHQTGSQDFTRIYEGYSSLPDIDHLQAFEYLHDMPERYLWADLVIARAGTGTISELAACGKAAILVPLPSAADDHQTKNAEALAQKNAAVLLPQNELTPQRLVQEILKFRSDSQLVKRLSQNIRGFHQGQGAKKIAQALLNLVKET